MSPVPPPSPPTSSGISAGWCIFRRDLVFSGTGKGSHVETDAADPVTVYGKTMVQAEDLLLAEVPDAALLRISLPMGPSFNHHAGAIDWIQSRFRADRPATLYFDEVRSCTYCGDLNKVFEAFLASEERGMFHCGGPRASTLYRDRARSSIASAIIRRNY